MRHQAVFFGFQFFHHGSHAAFGAMKGAMRPYARVIDASPPSTRLQISPLRRIDFQWRRLSEVLLLPTYRRKEPCVLHYFFPENTLFKGAEWKRHHKLVLTCHQPVESDPFQQLMQTRPGFVDGLKAADVIILMASNDRVAYQQIAPQAEVICIPHGVDTEFFEPQPREHSETKNVLTVGNWLRNYACWNRVVRRVLDQREDVCFTVIAGKNAQQEILAAFNGALPDTIRLLSGISDEELRDEYAKADLLFLPLIDAWANNALLEGAAMGLPQLVTDLPATREYLGDDNATFVGNNDPDLIAGRMIGLFDDDVVLKERGARLRDRMVEQFAWPVIAKRHAELYGRLLEKNR